MLVLDLGLGLSSSKSGGNLSPWLPTSVSGLLLWLRPSDESTITATGSNVDEIENLAGGQNFKQLEAVNRPQTGTTTLNGKNVLSFDGDYLSIDGTTAATPLTGLSADNATFGMIVKEYSSNTFNAAVICTKNSLGADLYTGKLGTLDRTYVFGNTDSTFEFVSPSIVSEDAWHAIVITSGADGLNIWVDGVQTVVDPTPVPSSVEWDAFWIGRRYTAVLNKMDMGDLIAYDSVLPQADIDALNGYLMAEAGL